MKSSRTDILNRKRVAIALITVGFGTLLIWFFSGGNASELNTRPLGRVTRGDLIQTVTVAGRVHPARRAVILPAYSGVVRRVFVKVGDQVKVGDPIVAVSPAGEEKESVFPMRAPLNGTVVQVNRREGEPVRENNDRDFLMRIDDLSRLQASASVAELDVAKLKLGMPAIARPAALLGASSTAKIREISLAPKDQDQWGNRSQQVEYEVLADLIDPSPELKSGMSVLLDLIPMRVENTLLIGHEYIDRDEEGAFVTLKSGEVRRVEVGLANEQFAEIRSGVAEGDEILMVNFYDLVRSTHSGGK